MEREKNWGLNKKLRRSRLKFETFVTGGGGGGEGMLGNPVEVCKI